jgi:DNA repair protein RadA/Sms
LNFVYNKTMPAKIQTRYVCQSCGRTAPRAMGRCPGCGSFGTMLEEVISVSTTSPGSASAGLGGKSQPRRLKDLDEQAEARLPLRMGEFARVLGGGVVPGSVVLVGGDPGIGKSTLMLQVAVELASLGRVLYVSGEESERQIKMRATRLLQYGRSGSAGSDLAGSDLAGSDLAGSEPLKSNPQDSAVKPGTPENLNDSSPDELFLVTETNLESILEHVSAVSPHLLVVDSIQTTYLPGMESSAGSVSQVRECASRLRDLAKNSEMAIFIIGHVTKEGVIAGPRVLEHIVDTVLYLEGDRFQSYRLLRSVKNRFGATSEVGVFEMHERGMVEVTNPSEAFLAERLVNVPGSAIAVTMEGTRPLLVEIQGLTSHTTLGNPRRTPNGVDFNRLLLTVAVLTRRIGLHLGEQDVFVNVVGGLQVEEPAADLAVAAAIASSMRDIPLRADTVLIGEVGLSGELRMVSQMPARLREAARLGFQRAIVPHRARRGEPWTAEIQVVEARSLREALSAALLSDRKEAT